MSAFFRFLELPGRKRALLASACLYVLVVRAALASMPLRVVIRRVAALRRRSSASSLDAAEAAWAMGAVAARIPGTRCLARSFALHLLLLRHGLDSRLLVGVAPAAGGIRAHAWVECGGQALEPAGQVAGYRRLMEIQA